jgi:molybdenum cofactor cytidylyltransferase
MGADARLRQVISGLILAAGAATRFGAPKQLAHLEGRPLLEHAIEAMLSAGIGRVVVVLGANAELIRKEIDFHEAEPVVCERWREGQAQSLAYGLGMVGDEDAVVISLGDQPGVSAEAIHRVVEHRGESLAVRASYRGRPGHPVLIEPELFPRIRALSGDRGARDVLALTGVREIACDDLADGRDIDTVEDLAALKRDLDAAQE